MMKKKLLFKGPVTTASGYGVHTRQILKGLLDTKLFDISVKCLNWGNTSFLLGDSPLLNEIEKLSIKYLQESKDGFKEYDASVQVTIPNEFEKLAKVNIGITAGIEVDLCSPEWIVKANQMVDVLFVPSMHSKNVFERTQFKDKDGNVLAINKPAYLAHEGFNHNLYNTAPNEKELFDFETKFNFLFVGLGINHKFDEERKNISNLVKWFCEAFKGNKEVGLVLKTAIVNNTLMDYENTKRMITSIKNISGAGEYPKIHLVHGRLSDEEMANLYKNETVKAFITLTHGEGFGLPLLEAAACGLPVIATNWSGHLDFLQVENEKTFVPLEFELVAVPESTVWPGVIENGSKWAAVKEDDVKLKMRKVHASYDKPKEWAMKLAEHVRQNFTEEKVMAQLASNVATILEQIKAVNPNSPEDLIKSIKSSFKPDDDGKKLLYTMPMSAGDVYISSAVIDGLKKKFPDHKIFFATSERYSSILNDNPNIHRVVPYQEWMTNVPVLEQMFDEVYTPNLSVQMVFSNWVHRGKGRLLANEMATQCNIELGDYFIKTSKPVTELPEKYVVLNPGSGQGQWEARSYIHWQDIVTNLVEELGDVKIVQTGVTDDPFYNGCVDFRGKTKDFNELAYVIENAELVLGIDSVTMHLAAGLGVNHVALFGSSYPTSTGPVIPKKVESSMDGSYIRPICKSVLLETDNRYGCEKACYQYSCSKNKDFPCINEINPSSAYAEVIGLVCPERESVHEYKESSPKISGYTHVFNAESGQYPYIESIKSMLGFCDEVIVVDGESTDGTVEKIKALDDPRVILKTRKWDWDEPGMDGMQKAYGRAMCSGDFLWQQDVDEVVHEDDYNKVRQLVKRFPKGVELVHLPVVELWGDSKTVRTDRHSWKWRLSRNDFKITHGIAKHAQVKDETGKLYAKKGMSDGCEYVDIMTHEYIPHAGFYTRELEGLRQSDPQEYGNVMNMLFEELPSVYHYSWANIPRKIKNFKQFWNKCWSNLYHDEQPEDRFPEIKSEDDLDAIQRVSEQLKARGGEHGKAETFQLSRTNPSIMK